MREISFDEILWVTGGFEGAAVVAVTAIPARRLRSYPQGSVERCSLASSTEIRDHAGRRSARMAVPLSISLQKSSSDKSQNLSKPGIVKLPRQSDSDLQTGNMCLASLVDLIQ
jgi:hypothetical protein